MIGARDVIVVRFLRGSDCAVRIPPGIEPKAPGERLPVVAPEVRRSWEARLRRDRAGALGALVRRGGGECAWGHKAHRVRHCRVIPRAGARPACAGSFSAGAAVLGAGDLHSCQQTVPRLGFPCRRTKVCMAQNFRHSEILTLARQTGKVTVEDLAAKFGVTAQTIRRDLTELCDIGQLARVHGGATIPSGVIALGLRGPAQPRLGGKGRDGAHGGGADPRRGVDLHEHRHDHGGGGAGAAEAPQPDGGDQQPQRREHPRHLAQLRGDRGGGHPAARRTGRWWGM